LTWNSFITYFKNIIAVILPFILNISLCVLREKSSLGFVWRRRFEAVTPRSMQCNFLLRVWAPSSFVLSPFANPSPLLRQFDIQTVKWQFTLTGNSTELNSNQLNCFCRFRRQHHTQKLVTCATQHFRPLLQPQHSPHPSVSLFLYAFSRISNVAYSAGHLKLDVQAYSPPLAPRKSNLKGQSAAPGRLLLNW